MRMKKNLKFIIAAFVIFALASCEQAEKQKEEITEDNNKTEKQEMVKEVLTAEKQKDLTPDKVLESLKEGNERYIANDLTPRDLPAQMKSTAEDGQYPEAIILSCVDSRVPVEYVFDRGIGDLFVARVAGNFVNEDILGSMEFACKVSGSKVVMVLGHESCGAVKSAVDDVKLGNITPMLEKIKPAIEDVEYEGEKTSKNAEYVHKVCKSNVHHTIAQIRKDSPILKEMEDNGEIKIVGGIYDLHTGEVKMVD